MNVVTLFHPIQNLHVEIQYNYQRTMIIFIYTKSVKSVRFYKKKHVTLIYLIYLNSKYV